MLKTCLTLAVSLLLCLSLAATSAKRPVERATEDLHILIWSDYIDPDLVKAFEASHDCHVKLDVYEETEAMLAKLQVGGGSGQGGFDLVVASDHVVPVLAKLGLVQALDLSKVPNAGNVDARFVRPAYDPKGEWSLPYQWGTVGLMYNRKKLGEIKRSWGVVFSAGERKGKFMLLDSPRDTLGAALRFGGQSVNSREKAALQAAGKAVLEAKGDERCVGFDGSVANAKKVITGQADIAMVYNGDALNAIKDSKSEDFDYLVPSEGSIIWVDTMVLPAKSPHAELALAFANFILDGKNGAQLSNYVNFATPNKAAMGGIDEASRRNTRIYPTEEQVKGLEYLEDVGSATQLYDAIWTAVKAR
jgi:spermidine/putrescine transport system substrate-binding protein